MGLDIYLYRSKNVPRVLELYKIEEESDGVRAEIDALEQRQECTPDPRFPEHICNLGYLRSSYNASGYNRQARHRGWPTFDEMFGASEDYIVTPDWQNVRNQARRLIQLAADKPVTHHVVECRPNVFLGLDALAPDEKTALKWFAETMERHPPREDGDMESFSNRQGDFFTKGLDVRAVIFGLDNFIGKKVLTAYLIVPWDGPDWYLQTVQIVEAMCDRVIASGAPHEFYCHWSG